MKNSVRSLLLIPFVLILILSSTVCACVSVVNIRTEKTKTPCPVKTGETQTPYQTESGSVPSGLIFAPDTPIPEETEMPGGTAPPPTPSASQTGDVSDPGNTTEPDDTAEPFVIGDNGTVYLTFDDGPCSLTPRLLDILDEYNIKATFFTVGYFVEKHPDIIRDAAARGHLIACHTYSHNYNAVYQSADAFMADVRRWEKAVINVLGALPEKLCLRFPGGSRNSYLNKTVRAEIINALNAAGYCWYDWNFGDNDKWPAGNTEHLPMEEYLLRSYRTTFNWAAHGDKPLIFLAHDTCESSINIISSIIEDLIEKGFEFATLADCPFPYLEM